MANECNRDSINDYAETLTTKPWEFINVGKKCFSKYHTVIGGKIFRIGGVLKGSSRVCNSKYYKDFH